MSVEGVSHTWSCYRLASYPWYATPSINDETETSWWVTKVNTCPIEPAEMNSKNKDKTVVKFSNFRFLSASHFICGVKNAIVYVKSTYYSVRGSKDQAGILPLN
jgi:hypothetical protein